MSPPVLKSADDLAALREANLIVADVLDALEAMVAPGVTTLDLDRRAEALCRSLGAEPAFLGYHGYPASICASVNEVVVHGIPSAQVALRPGDIIGLDFGVVYRGFVGDAARTVPVGEVSPVARRLLEATQGALAAAIAACRVGGRVEDLSAAIQSHAESRGYSVVRDFVGHGIGRRMHEEPQVPNFVDERSGFRASLRTRLRPGLVLAIEPMVNVGTHEVVVLEDEWTAVTADGCLSAHFEHSVAIREEGVEVLSRPRGA